MSRLAQRVRDAAITSQRATTLNIQAMTSNHALRATIVVGNPKTGSRTRAVGVALAETALGHIGDAGTVTVVEVAAIADRLFAWGDLAVAEAKSAVLDADLLVVASPVYKASYTGLLKAFLDQFGRDELGALATVPLMVGAAPHHALAVEDQLRPVLVEIGASCPTRVLYVLEADVGGTEEQFAAWAAVWGDALAGVVRARQPVGAA
jgi:FMN reductase